MPRPPPRFVGGASSVPIFVFATARVPLPRLNEGRALAHHDGQELRGGDDEPRCPAQEGGGRGRELSPKMGRAGERNWPQTFPGVGSLKLKTNGLPPATKTVRGACFSSLYLELQRARATARCPAEGRAAGASTDGQPSSARRENPEPRGKRPGGEGGGQPGREQLPAHAPARLFERNRNASATTRTPGGEGTVVHPLNPLTAFTHTEALLRIGGIRLALLG